jgi:hypothetical protein
MWSRAKRTDKGEKLDERVWAVGSQHVEGKERAKEEEVLIKKGMKEAVETAYGSDPEDEE